MEVAEILNSVLNTVVKTLKKSKAAKRDEILMHKGTALGECVIDKLQTKHINIRQCSYTEKPKHVHFLSTT